MNDDMLHDERQLLPIEGATFEGNVGVSRINGDGDDLDEHLYHGSV